MQKIEEYNDQEAIKLDETFKEILTHVRTYILQLTSADNVQLCKDWLEKLHNANSQRRLRNEYLLELCRQLRTGRIGGVFSRLPPNGLLLPLPKSYHMVCSSSSVSDPSSCITKPLHSCLKQTIKCKHQKHKPLVKYRAVDTTNINHCLDSNIVPPTARSYNRSTIRKNQLKIYEQRIDTLSIIIGELQTQNEYLKQQLLENSEKYNYHLDNHLYSSINRLTSDVTTLKAKLLEIQKMKNSLEEYCTEIIQQYHSTVVDQLSPVKDQLDEMRLKNGALNTSVVIIDEKLEEIIHGKKEQIKELEKQWMEKIRALCDQFEQFVQEKNKELEMTQSVLMEKDIELSQKNAERKEDLELLKNKIHFLEIKLESKIKDEDALQATLADKYTILKDEFIRLKSEVECDMKQQHENLLLKVSELKKTVVKLEKSKEKVGHDYEKKMLRVIQNKDLEIKSLQLQLQEQKNEFSALLSTKKQSEVDNIVSHLEKRYKTLLAEKEATTESQIQEYLKKIAELEDQVLKLKRL